MRTLSFVIFIIYLLTSKARDTVSAVVYIQVFRFKTWLPLSCWQLIIQCIGKYYKVKQIYLKWLDSAMSVVSISKWNWYYYLWKMRKKYHIILSFAISLPSMLSIHSNVQSISNYLLRLKKYVWHFRTRSSCIEDIIGQYCCSIQRRIRNMFGQNILIIG